MNELFVVDAIVLFVSFFGGLFFIIKTFSSVTDKFRRYMFLGPFALLVPGVMTKGAMRYLLYFMLFFFLGFVYFYIRNP